MNHRIHVGMFALFCLVSLFYSYKIVEFIRHSEELEGNYVLTTQKPNVGPFQLEGIKKDVAVLSTGDHNKKVYTLSEGEHISLTEGSVQGTITIQSITSDAITMKGTIQVERDTSYWIFLMILWVSFTFGLGLIYSFLVEGFQSLRKKVQIQK